jgi:hypothetical protein
MTVHEGSPQSDCTICVADCQFVRRDDAHATVARGDEDEFGAAADGADLEGFRRLAA